MPKLTYFKIVKEDTDTVIFDAIIDGDTYECSAPTLNNKIMLTPFVISTGKELFRMWWYSGSRIENSIMQLYRSGTKEWKENKQP